MTVQDWGLSGRVPKHTFMSLMKKIITNEVDLIIVIIKIETGPITSITINQHYGRLILEQTANHPPFS